MTKEKIRKYVFEETLHGYDDIEDDTQLFEEGIFDSMGLLLLIEFLNEEFGIETTDEELLIENFSSIDAISKFVENKKS